MLRIPFSAFGALCMIQAANASPFVRSTAYDEIIAWQAKVHGVPEAFIHRTVMRESRYQPGLVHKHCFGLMQLKYGTARGLGYKGDARGLLDPKVNLTYGVIYLANAYRLADGDEERATTLYRGGYYYFAKHKNKLDTLQTASVPDLEPAPPQQSPQSPQNPVSGLLSFLAPPAEAAASNDSQQDHE
jgi:soluble lytic murein transglycosylase-like protein